MSDFEQFEATQERHRQARQVVHEWLSTIDETKTLGQRVALLGYAKEGMDIALIATALENNPPTEYLDFLAQPQPNA